MYEELIEDLRRHHCDAKEDDTQEVCEECAYDVIIADKSVPSGIASVCVCGLMHRAADAIEELSKQHEAQRNNLIALLNDKPRWIPVTEQLPEYGESVLCYFANNKQNWKQIWINRIIDEETGEWYIDGATAWMNLPEPPKGDE